MKNQRLLAVLFLSACALSRAQDLVVYSTAAPAMAEATAAGPAYPGPAVFRFPVPVPPLPAAAFPAGDLTLNNATGVLTYTNGVLIGQANDTAYAPIAPVLPVMPAPAFMPPPITGLAINSATGLLWVTNGILIGAVAAAPGFPVAVPPVPLAAILGPVPMVTGLDWDPVTGSLWAVTAAGVLYNFIPPPAFGLIAGPIPAPVPLPGPATDVVLARYGAPPMAAGLYVQTTLGTVNYATGIVTPVLPGIPAGTACGIAFHSYPDQLPGACGCGALFGPAVLGFPGPATIGNAGFALTVSGVPPGGPVFVAIDGGFVAGGAPWPGGCTLYMSPISATLTITPLVASPLGVATLPAPIPPAPALIGLTGFVQAAIPCSANPTGIVLSNMAQVVVGAP